MKIYCIDQTNDSLFFAREILEALLGTGMELHLRLNSLSYTAYGAYFSIFPGLTILDEHMPDPKFDAAIIFTESDTDAVPAPLGLPTMVISMEQTGKTRTHSVIELIRRSERIQIDVNCSPGHSLKCVPDAGDCVDLLRLLITDQDLRGTKVLVSAGPTAEDIDPVRFLTNRSTGKMGIALARAAFLRGANVHLVIGPTSEKIPSYFDVSKVRSAQEMAGTILNNFPGCDLYFGSAAVADFTPEEVFQEKIKKKNHGLTLKLKRTVDILESLKDIHLKQQTVIGFSVETSNEVENSIVKMRRKNMDMIVVNNPKEKDAGFAVDTNKVTIIIEGQNPVILPVMTKFELANRILDYAVEMRTK